MSGLRSWATCNHDCYEGKKEKMVQLSYLFNSEAGKLYSLSSNLKAVKLILEGDISGKNLGEKVRVNLQDISKTIGKPLRTEKEIDKAIKSLDIEINKRAKAFVAEKGLRYYNEDIHFSTFALPNFVKQLIQK
jgi:hypothetical protein